MTIDILRDYAALIGIPVDEVPSAVVAAVRAADQQGYERAKEEDRVVEPRKDGTEYLCFVPGLGLGWMVLYWADGYWREKANGMGLKTEPTHFYSLRALTPTKEQP